MLETDDPDWYLVQSNKGEIGLVPCNYVSSIGEQAEHQEEQTVTETSIYTPPPVPQVPVTAPPAITAPPTTTPPVLTQRVRINLSIRVFSLSGFLFIECIHSCQRRRTIMDRQ